MPLSKIKKRLEAYQPKLKFLWNMFRQRFIRLPKSRPKVLFILDDDRSFVNFGRYFYLFMRTFVMNGYSVVLLREFEFEFYNRMELYSRRPFNLKYFKNTYTLPKNPAEYICLCDTTQRLDSIKDLPWQKIGFIGMAKNQSYPADVNIPIPFFMHPNVYDMGLDKNLNQHREASRKLKVFFAGNIADHNYDLDEFKAEYGDEHMTRLQSMAVMKKMDGGQVLYPQADEFREMINAEQYIDQCVLLVNPDNRIHPREWLSILSNSDFFICFSGDLMPMCHNVVEAMAIGSIPIICYNDWFFPTLEDGVNALVFKDDQSLLATIEKALVMNPEEILKLRRNVIAYYEEYLKPEQFIKLFEQDSPKNNFALTLLPKATHVKYK